MRPATLSRGRLLAAILAGAWRPSQPGLELSAAELDDMTPLLLGSGAGALGWWRVRRTGLCRSRAAFQLQQAYRLHTLQAALHEQEIVQVLTRLRSAGVEPILIKGWTVARLYPVQGLRPYGDIDLWVPPEQSAMAEAALKRPDCQEYNVDLHVGFDKLDDQGLDESSARSQLVKLGEVDVRVLAPEDHLRLLCLHLLRHGAWRPLWLCDIAVALESRPADFNWDRCLGRNRRQADWVACAIGLAHQLLGAQVEDTPVAERVHHLPGWLVPGVLKQWETPRSIDHAAPELFITTLRHPARVPRALRQRWPDPIEATFNLRGPLNGLPRLPFQLGLYLRRAATFALNWIHDIYHFPFDIWHLSFQWKMTHGSSE